MFRKVTRGSLLVIYEQAAQLAEQGCTQGRAWSLGQICEHLTLAINSTVMGSSLYSDVWRAQGTRWTRMKRWVFKQVTLRAAFIPENVNAPDSVTPADDVDLDSALDRLKQAAESFEEAYRQPNVIFSDHSILGRFSGPGWRRFHHVHASHHFRFVRKP
ncbi:MAG: DUF1569 domain-containing protein [Planctomycetota bacterium]|jgi:hypothetical protein